MEGSPVETISLEPYNDRISVIAAYLEVGVLEGVDNGNVRQQFDIIRYAQSMLESANNMGESIEHSPADLMNQAIEALQRAESYLGITQYPTEPMEQ